MDRKYNLKVVVNMAMNNPEGVTVEIHDVLPSAWLPVFLLKTFPKFSLSFHGNVKAQMLKHKENIYSWCLLIPTLQSWLATF